MARALARALRSFWNRFRFRRWVLRLRFELRRHGAKLFLDGGGDVRFDRPPRIKAYPGRGSGGGSFRLTLGERVDLGENLVLEIFADGETELTLGDRARLQRNVRILVREGSISIGRDAEVRDGAWLKSDGELRVGSGATIGPYSAIHCAGRVVLADLVGLAERVSIADSDHKFDGTDQHYMGKRVTVSPVLVGRGTMVAFNSVVLRGASIGKNSVVAANSVVRGGCYAVGSLLAGNPAEEIRDLREEPIPNGGAGLAA